MRIDIKRKTGMILTAVSATVLLAACSPSGDEDRASGMTTPPPTAQGGADSATNPMAANQAATPSAADTTAGERAAATGGSMGDRASNAMGDARDSASSAGDQAQSAAGDAAITAKVKSALVAEDDVRSLSINVDTEEGRVTLEGEVPSAEQSMRIEKLAQNVEGVKAVENKLKVQGS
jgi:hypothetical protein